MHFRPNKYIGVCNRNLAAAAIPFLWATLVAAANPSPAPDSQPGTGSVRARFEYLAIGAVKPAGWIRAQMGRDLHGFTGHLDELTRRAASDIYGRDRVSSYEKNAAGVLVDTPQSWWDGETEGVWMDGLVRMACLADDEVARRKVDDFIRHILSTQSEDGYIGVYVPECRYRHPGENGELWTQSRILTAMLAYYEATGKREILAAVERAARLTMSHYGPGRSYFCNPRAAGGVGHGLMFIDVMEWLHRLTGDKAYVEFARFCYEDYGRSLEIRDKDNQLDHLLKLDEPFVGHAAHTMEHLRAPLWLYYATGDPKLGQACANAFTKTQRYLTPSGACIGDEMIEGRKPGPGVPYEYCAMTELLASTQSALAKTGDALYAELAENVALNAAQGARLPDGKAISYFTRDNRYSATNRDELGKFSFSPTHERAAVCCNPNAGKLMPYYVNRMWMRQVDREEGLAALLYGPCSVETRIDGVRVRIDEETDYPFAQEIRLTMHPEREVLIPLVLRIPRWSTSSRVTADGAEVRREGDYYIVRKRWVGGDRISLTFEAKVCSVRSADGELALRHGPLLYVLPIPDQRRITHTFALPGFADLDILPAGEGKPDAQADPAPSRCSLPAAHGGDGFGFVLRRDVEAAMLRPWDRSPVRLDGELISESRSRSVSLVPIGCTVLRQATFPVAEKN